MGKRKDPNQVLEQQSRGRVRTLLAEWVVNSLDDEDYAFDFEIRPTNEFDGSGTVSPSPFYAQLKASRWFDDSDEVWWDFDTEFLLDDCLQASVPVVLFLYERRSDSLHWCVAQKYCWDILDEERPDWRDQTTVRIRIDREPLTDVEGRTRLRNAVERTQRRISTREFIATSRRGTFAQPQGTTLASSDEVRDHKRERIEEAMQFTEADQVDQAIRKLMDVYQMPEEDEPTLDAIRYLIELRETDDASIAFAKIRFASKGRQLAREYEREELRNQFTEELDDAWDYIEEQFLGSRYHHREAMQEVLVLDVEDWGISHEGADLVALIQWGSGELGEEDAHAIAADNRFELKQSGESRDLRDDVCAERNHEFDTDVLKEAPGLAKCTKCGLSRDTIQQWLNQEVPHICDDCGSVVYDIVYQRDTGRCSDCR